MKGIFAVIVSLLLLGCGTDTQTIIQETPSIALPNGTYIPFFEDSDKRLVISDDYWTEYNIVGNNVTIVKGSYKYFNSVNMNGGIAIIDNFEIYQRIHGKVTASIEIGEDTLHITYESKAYPDEEFRWNTLWKKESDSISPPELPPIHPYIVWTHLSKNLFEENEYFSARLTWFVIAEENETLNLYATITDYFDAENPLWEATWEDRSISNGEFITITEGFKVGNYTLTVYVEDSMGRRSDPRSTFFTVIPGQVDPSGKITITNFTIKNTTYDPNFKFGPMVTGEIHFTIENTGPAVNVGIEFAGRDVNGDSVISAIFEYNAHASSTTDEAHDLLLSVSETALNLVVHWTYEGHYVLQ